MFSDVYDGARVLLTGDTGFKGGWLAFWLKKLGAEVHGLALPPDSAGGLYLQGRIAELIQHNDGDIRDPKVVDRAVERVRPDLVIHMAAQAIVRESYVDPVGTMMTNAMGTTHVCDALRRLDKRCALLVITSDKCYANNEWVFGYRENDAMGGSDPYSASKGVAELITASWRKSFFPVLKLAEHRKAVASARAGNVIGPGDWAADRIVPDAVRALIAGKPIVVRNPNSVRPWQHVLEPLSGYLALSAQLMGERAADFAEGWNFGPLPSSTRNVRDLVETFIGRWGAGAWHQAPGVNALPEANLLRLSIDKAEARLTWRPAWNFETTITRTADGYRRLLEAGNDVAATRAFLDAEIDQYVRDAHLAGAVWANPTT